MRPESLRRICLVGVRGVGKTTLIRGIIGELPDVDYVVGSSVLRELAGADFARFDHLPAAEKLRYREGAVTWMEDRQARVGKHILCDGHTALLDESSGRIGTVFTERDCAFFRELILLEAPADVVLNHRVRDTSKRRSLDASVIVAELAAERASSRAIAERYGMALHELPPSADPTTPARLKELLCR